MMENTIIKTSKYIKNFVCEKCDFRCSKKGDYNRHLKSKKHNTTTTTKIQQKILHSCKCGKSYNHRASLFNHKQVCTYKTENIESECIYTIDKTEAIVEMLLKGNREMKQTIIDLCKKIEPISVNTTNNINSNNNNIFNIQVFLNEDCKDAMNMSEFIESIQLSIEDVEKIGREGQTEGMSKLFINKLKDLDIVKRPVHCSDLKNKIIFVKDQDKWEEETNSNPKIKEALDKIAVKTMDKLPEVTQDPDKYLKTISEVSRDPRDDKEIISKIAKEVCVEN